jgi:hypothetical protein
MVDLGLKEEDLMYGDVPLSKRQNVNLKFNMRQD